MKLIVRIAHLGFSLAAGLSSSVVMADDIDIFVGASAGTAKAPNVLIVVDNTPNWSRQSQQWPAKCLTWDATLTYKQGDIVTVNNQNYTLSAASISGSGGNAPGTSASWVAGGTCSPVQGMAEVSAISRVLSKVSAGVNVGVMEFVTEGNSGDNGGFTRESVKAMAAAEKVILGNKMLDTYRDINGVHEKTNGSRPYGNLMYDVYNYLSSGNSFSPNGVYADKADATGYTTPYTKFKSPLSVDNACASTYLIFIGNPRASGPMADSAANTTALAGLNGDTTPLPLPKFTQQSIIGNLQKVGNTSTCYSTPTANDKTAVNAAYGWGWSEADNTCRLFAATTTATGASKTITLSDGSTLSCNVYDETKPKVATPSDLAAGCNAYTQGCIVGEVVSTGLADSSTTSTGWASSAPVVAYNAQNQPSSISYKNAAGVTQTINCPTTDSQNRGPIIAGSCKFEYQKADGSFTSTPTATTTATNNNVEEATTNACFDPQGYSGGTVISGNAYPSALPLTHTNNSASSVTAATILNNAVLSSVKNVPSSQCDIKGTDQNCSLDCPAENACAYSVITGATGGCPKQKVGSTWYQSSALKLKLTPTAFAQYTIKMSWEVSVSSGGSTCAANTSRFAVYGADKQYTNVASGTTYSDPGPWNADEWARFLFRKGVTITDSVSGKSSNQAIKTYTIDVYNKQPNADHTSLLLSMAKNGGGRYFTAKNEEDIVNALTLILTEIQSVNSTFASASLPVSATNRTQNANQVFIGMFRPDPKAYPRWFGNLKQYAVGRINTELDLVDVYGNPATNLQTGFLADCAVSAWTLDSVTDVSGSKVGYWQNVEVKSNEFVSPDPASTCVSGSAANVTVQSVYSDYPDGPSVEKGAVAGVIRRGNNPPTTTGTPTWSTSRKVFSRSSNDLTPFTTTSTGLSSSLVNYVLGKDVQPEQKTSGFRAATDADTVRSSVHGDVVHSRPLPINYGNEFGVIAYYGSNDGAFRAVDSKNGNELWAFVPPEFHSRLERLQLNSPFIKYPNGSTEVTSLPKDYLFDGSIGIAQNVDNSEVLIYPTQRRGGRMVYGMDVTKPYLAAASGDIPTYPRILWHQGCETNSTAADINCTSYVKTIDTTSTLTDFSGMGQTWSVPSVTYIAGYGGGAIPVVIFGGGYDTCEDSDTATPTCTSPKGSRIYILDARTGVPIRSFATTRSVAADVALVDVDNDNLADFAYVPDTGGNIYRINFIDGPTAKTALSPDKWSMQRVAYTNGGNRKMLFNVSLLPYKGEYVYLAVTTGDRERPLITNYPYTTPVTNRAYVYLDKLTKYNAEVRTAYPTGTTKAAQINYVIPCDLDSNDCSVDYTTSIAKTDCATTSKKLLPDSEFRAWRMDFPNRGEQGVTSTLIAGGMVTFSTNRPLPAAEGTCASALGEALGYWVNLLNASGAINPDGATCGGERSAKFAGGGLPPSPVTGVVPVDGKPTVVVIGTPSRTGGQASPVKPEQIKPSIPPVRTRKYQYNVIDR